MRVLRGRYAMESMESVLSVVAGAVGCLVFAVIVMCLFMSKQRRDIQELRERIEAIEGVPSSAAETETNDTEAETEQQPEKKPPKPWDGFLRKYTVLSRLEDAAEGKSLSDTLMKAFKIKQFSCINAADRSANPTVHPEFRDIEEDGEFWAYEDPAKEGTFYVVPQPFLTYDRSKDSDSGMKEVFATKFAGGSWKRFIVDIPAICTCENGVWETKFPGKIRLLSDDE